VRYIAGQHNRVMRLRQTLTFSGDVIHVLSPLTGTALTFVFIRFVIIFMAAHRILR
jgi:hypothetical protein